jgi:hypothetical protein
VTKKARLLIVKCRNVNFIALAKSTTEFPF